MAELFFLFVLAHVLADFLLQTEGIAAAKCRGNASGYIKHGAGHAAALAVLTHHYFSLEILLLWLLIPAAHLLIDWLKNRLVPAGHPADSAAFLADQALHLGVIFCAWQWAAAPPCAPVAAFYGNLLTPAGAVLAPELGWSCGALPLLKCAVAYGYAVFGGSVLVRKVLDLDSLRLPGSIPRSGETRRAGRYIGFFERALIMTFTLAGAYSSIAFALTAKSIARYKELENRDFAEYYLAGTLLSALLAILGGLFLRAALGL